jgi:hypothetical protein
MLCFLVAITSCAAAIGHVDFFRFEHSIRFYLCLHLFAQGFLCDISKTPVCIDSCDKFTQVLWPAVALRHRPQDERSGWI